MTAPDITGRYVLKVIQEQRERCPFHDVIVKVGERTFKCHRLFLSASSEFFREKFSGNAKAPEVVVEEIDPNVFDLVLEFVYRGNNVISLNNVMDIWRAAHKLAIRYLVELCENFLSCYLSNRNIVDIYVNAKAMDNVKLLKLSWDLIVKNFDDLKTADEILRLDFVDMKRLISLDHLQVNDEDLIVGLILRWIQYDEGISVNMAESGIDYEVLIESTVRMKETGGATTESTSDDDGMLFEETDVKKAMKEAGGLEDSVLSSFGNIPFGGFSSHPNDDVFQREKYLPELLKASKIFLVSGPCLQSLLDNEMVFRNPEAIALVKQACGYKMYPWRTGDYVPSYATYRTTNPLINVPIVIASDNDMSKVTNSALMGDGTWKRLDPPPKELMDCKAVAYGNNIYATNSSGLGRMFKFSPESNKWTKLPNMMTKRVNHGLLSHGSYIYAVGGDGCKTIERFSVGPGARQQTGVGQWEQIGVMKKALTNISLSSFGSTILIFGTDPEGILPEGTDCTEVTTIQCFDTDRNRNFKVVATMAGPAKNLVCLRRENDTYLLQETGSLYKIRKCKADRVEMEFCGAVCNYTFQMITAALVFDQLVILGNNIDLSVPQTWETPENELFKSVKIVHTKGTPRCLLNSVVPKTFLVEDEEDENEELGGKGEEEEKRKVDKKKNKTAQKEDKDAKQQKGDENVPENNNDTKANHEDKSGTVEENETKKDDKGAAKKEEKGGKKVRENAKKDNKGEEEDGNLAFHDAEDRAEGGRNDSGGENSGKKGKKSYASIANP